MFDMAATCFCCTAGARHLRLRFHLRVLRETAAEAPPSHALPSCKAPEDWGNAQTLCAKHVHTFHSTASCLIADALPPCDSCFSTR